MARRLAVAVLLGVVCGVGVGGGGGVGGAWGQSTRPGGGHGGAGRGGAGSTTAPAEVPNPIPDAVKELLKEFEEAQGPNRTLPRRDADYFNKAPVVPTAEQVWAAMGGRYGTNVRADAYVKWQLLSALPARADQAGAQRLVAMLRRAPAPLPNPLLDPRGRQEVEVLAGKARPGNEGQVGEKVREIQNRHFDQNRPIIGLRDELIDRLPDGTGKLVMRWEELAVRAKIGIDVGRARDDLLKLVDAWATEASPQDLQLMVQTMSRLRGTRSDEMIRGMRPDGAGLRRDMYRTALEAYDNTMQTQITRLNERLRSRGR